MYNFLHRIWEQIFGSTVVSNEGINKLTHLHHISFVVCTVYASVWPKVTIKNIKRLVLNGIFFLHKKYSDGWKPSRWSPQNILVCREKENSIRFLPFPFQADPFSIWWHWNSTLRCRRTAVCFFSVLAPFHSRFFAKLYINDMHIAVCTTMMEVTRLPFESTKGMQKCGHKCDNKHHRRQTK